VRDRSDDVDEAVRAYFADVPPMNEQVFQTGREQVRTMVEAEPVATVTVLDRVTSAPTRPRRIRAAPLVAAAAVIAVAVAGTIALLPGHSAPTETPAATETGPNDPLPPMPAQPLNSIGDLADKVTDPQVNPGEFVVQQTRDGDGFGSATWTSHDGTRQWYTSSTAPPYEVGDGGMPLTETCVPGDNGQICGTWLWLFPKTSVLATMPRDPAAIYAGLRGKTMLPGEDPALTGMNGNFKAREAAEQLLLLLRTPPVILPADLRAALLRTLGYLPGLTVTKDARTSDNRPAIAIRGETDGGHTEGVTLLDPATTRVLEASTIVLKPGKDMSKPGDTVRTLRFKTGVVRVLGELPT
jgi:hypothetical protein